MTCNPFIYPTLKKKCINKQKQRKQNRYRKFRINKIGKYFHQICQNPKEYSVNKKKKISVNGSLNNY